MIFKDQTGKEYDIDVSKIDINWRISVYGVVIKEDKTLMLIPHFNSQWQFPGGKIEIDESIDDALRRECLEEVGYKIDTANKKLVFFNEQNFYDSYEKKYFHSLQLTFKVELGDSKQYEDLIEKDEGMDYGEVDWISLNDLMEYNVQHTHWPIVKLLQKDS